MLLINYLKEDEGYIEEAQSESCYLNLEETSILWLSLVFWKFTQVNFII